MWKCVYVLCLFTCTDKWTLFYIFRFYMYVCVFLLVGLREYKCEFIWICFKNKLQYVSATDSLVYMCTVLVRWKKRREQMQYSMAERWSASSYSQVACPIQRCLCALMMFIFNQTYQHIIVIVPTGNASFIACFGHTYLLRCNKYARTRRTVHIVMSLSLRLCVSTTRWMTIFVLFLTPEKT